jgi:hypothetical protein
MSKKSPNSYPYDEANAVLAMLEIVSDPEHYKSCFGIKDKDVEKMRELLDKKNKSAKPNFIEKS